MRLTAALVLISVFTAASGSAQPVLTFADREVTASQVTAGGKSAWLAIAHDAQPERARISTLAELVKDDDADGVARLATNLAAVPESVWLTVDIATGAITAATPGAHKLRRTQVKLSKLDKLDAALEYLTFLVVRPGVGAWTVTVEDSGLADSDHADNGAVLASLDRLEPLGDSPDAPDGLRDGDVVAAVDPMTLHVYDLRLK
jgi:hypothetical protein